MRRLVSSSFVLMICTVLCASAHALEEIQGASTGVITGQILVKGNGPLPGGTVFFFNEMAGPPPSPTKYWRVPTDAFSVDESGRFKAVLSEGTYFMGATRKLSGEPLGPPLDGDFFFISQDEQGNPKAHVVRKNETLDMGVISEAVPFSSQTLAKEGVTSVEGTIVDERGKPVKGIVVFAFSTPTMVGRPLFVSGRSDKDGRYLLRLHGGGTYYLKARVNYEGGPPSADQVMGVYRGGQSLAVGTGERRKGIDIKVSKVGIAERVPQ